MSQRKLELADSSLYSVASPIARCYLGKLYFLGFRRGNRYGPSPLYHEGNIEALYLTLSDVELHVEPQRKRGTYWEAVEVPTVVIESDDAHRLLLVGDGWGGDTLASFQPQLPPKRQFGHLARELMAQLPKEGWALRCGRQLPVASFPFALNRSIPGPTLSWRSEWWITDPKSAIRLVAAICLWLAEKPANEFNRKG